MRKVYIAVGILSAVVIAAVIYSFTVIGSPGKRFAIQTDQTRISNFNNISYAVQSYYSLNNKLPEKLADLTSYKDQQNDPKTKLPYDYLKVTDTSYKLCANFELDSSEIKKENQYYDDFFLFKIPTAKAQFSSPATDKNAHKKGYDCITYEIPEYYIKTPVPVPANKMIKLAYDGDILSWDDLSKSNYTYASLLLYDAKGVKILTTDALRETKYRPYITNWKTAKIEIYANGKYQTISNEATNTKYKECANPTNGICY